MSSSIDYTPLESAWDAAFDWYLEYAKTPEYRQEFSEQIQRENTVQYKSYERRVPTARFVYIVHCPPSFYKIGIAGSVQERILQIDSNCPLDVVLVHSFMCDNAKEAERVLHQRFHEQRHKREWFILDGGQVDDLKRIASYKNGKFRHRNTSR